MHALSYLDDFKGDTPPKRIWNAMVREIARRLPKILDFGIERPGEFIYPWKLDCDFWDDAPPDYPGNPALLYQVTFAQSPHVNDQPVTAIYQKSGDPRGWVMPVDYPDLAPDDPLYSASTVDRPLYEPDDPPFLVLQAPPPGQLAAQWTDFVPVQDAERPDFFKTEDMWPLTLMRASIFTTADPGLASFYQPIPRVLTRFRVFASKMPIQTIGSTGNAIEIARLYLTRDPTNDPSKDQIYPPEQLVFWDLQTLLSVTATGVPFQYWTT